MLATSLIASDLVRQIGRLVRSNVVQLDSLTRRESSGSGTFISIDRLP